MRQEKTGLLINKSPWNYGIEFAYVRQVGDLLQAAQPLTIETLDTSKDPHPPIPVCFSLREFEVQELFNRLWELGYRPKDGTGNSGHIEAVSRHLEDMRKLVFEQKP